METLTKLYRTSEGLLKKLNWAQKEIEETI